MENDNILVSIRRSLGLSADDDSFEDELKLHLNSTLGVLNQNGIGKKLVVVGKGTTWIELKDETQIIGNEYFNMIPMFVLMSIKLLFDPPPPSNVQYYKNYMDELLWRLKIAYETEGTPAFGPTMTTTINPL